MKFLWSILSLAELYTDDTYDTDADANNADKSWSHIGEIMIAYAHGMYAKWAKNPTNKLKLKF